MFKKACVNKSIEVSLYSITNRGNSAIRVGNSSEDLPVGKGVTQKEYNTNATASSPLQFHPVVPASSASFHSVLQSPHALPLPQPQPI